MGRLAGTGIMTTLGTTAEPRHVWSDFKQRLAAMTTDIYQYGQAKAGPTQILMIAAESWASQTQWAPP
jgi:hypothetical protein